MYSNSSSKSYEKKYKKYKKKYQILKIINGGDCDPLPNPEEEDIVSRENLLDLCPEERITIQNKCYEVKSLHTWIIKENKENKKKLPFTLTDITPEDKQRLIEAYDELTFVQPNILTREKLIQLYPNLQQEARLFLSNKGYTDIALGTFNNLPNLQGLWLDNNQIRELQPGTFNNLPNLYRLYLQNNQIRELQPGIFDNLPKLNSLFLYRNQIQELQPGTFNNLPNLIYLSLLYNQIRESPPDLFNNVPRLQVFYI